MYLSRKTLRVGPSGIPETALNRMMFFSTAPADGAASSRRAKKAGVIVAWALVLFAVYGNHGMFSRSDSSKPSSVGPSMSQRRSEPGTLEGHLPKYTDDDGRVGSVIPSTEFLAMQNFTGEQGHCRGAKAGKSCCGPRGSGSFILPLFPNQELAWPRWFRALLYRK